VDDARPHLILLAYLYPPHQEIGALRPFRFRKYLERMGHTCHVITASPQTGNSPGVAVVPDELGALWDSPGARLPPKAWMELLFRKLMFPGHVGFLWSRAAAAECRRIVSGNPGARFVVFSTYPPMGSLLAGLLARRRSTPWIADLRDPIGGSATVLRWLRVRFWTRVLETLSFRAADAVIANVQAAADAWRRRYPWLGRRLHVIYNGFDPEDAPHARPIPARDHRLIVHAGALYHGRNPNLVIESLSRLRRQGIPEAAYARILLLGGVDFRAGLNQALQDEAQREGWLEMRPPVPRTEALRTLEHADGLLLVQPQSNLQVPGKLFEYISIGRPILALVPRESAIESILQNAAVPHICIYADDGPQTADAKLLDFLRLPNTSTPMNSWFQTNFSVERQAQQLARIIDELAR